MVRSQAVAREPLDAAPLIPLAAAGRQPLFFYGTLTDLEILAYVLARPLDLDDLAPAALPHFQRLRARDASYPVLAPAAGQSAPGLLLRRASRRDIVRINHFESGEYRAELRPVRQPCGALRQAWLYAALDTLAPAAEPWDLASWQERDKPGFLAACDRWMLDCPDVG